MAERCLREKFPHRKFIIDSYLNFIINEERNLSVVSNQRDTSQLLSNHDFFPSNCITITISSPLRRVPFAKAKPTASESDFVAGQLGRVPLPDLWIFTWYFMYIRKEAELAQRSFCRLFVDVSSKACGFPSTVNGLMDNGGATKRWKRLKIQGFHSRADCSSDFNESRSPTESVDGEFLMWFHLCVGERKRPRIQK